MSIYLDHNATTLLDPEVWEVMRACFEHGHGNPSSPHAPGTEARRHMDDARRHVARLIGARTGEIIFTSGGTEANNLAVLGGLRTIRHRKARVVVSAIEHQAILQPCLHLERAGTPVARVGVNALGVLEEAAYEAALDENTALISVMLANNDTGVIQPVAKAAASARSRGALVHCDAVQAAGKIAVDVNELGVDMLTLSAHKLCGPQGVGALVVRSGVQIEPLTFGGHQERGMRPGTENVAAIAGFGKACELAAKRLRQDAEHMARLRDALEEALRVRLPEITINGEGAPRLPNTSNISFNGMEGEMLAMNLDCLGVAVSTGAACQSSSHEPSHVLLAMGQTAQQARASIRFSLGRTTTGEDTDMAIACVIKAVQAMQGGRS